MINASGLADRVSSSIGKPISAASTSLLKPQDGSLPVSATGAEDFRGRSHPAISAVRHQQPGRHRWQH